MVYGKNIFSHFPDHVVPVDIPEVAGGSIVEFGMEISVTDKFIEFDIGNCNSNNGVAFLKVLSV